MRLPTVWVNKYLSNTGDVLQRLLHDRTAGEFRLIYSHPRRHTHGPRGADRFFGEPSGLGDAEYVQWCLQFAREHEIQLFLPGHRLLSIAAAKERFADAGTRLLTAASVDALRVLVDKSATYRALEGSGCPIPDYRLVTTVAEFREAVAELQRRHEKVCFKPARSVYGLGFYILDKSSNGQNGVFIHPNEAIRCLERKQPFAPTLVMEYLSGPERSVDCLAHQGQLICSIIRRKDSGQQHIERHEHIEAIIKALTRKFTLHGIFNIQFADAHGKPHLLEINPRMSGGFPIALQAGVNLLLWAIRLSLGLASPADVPQPRWGFTVLQPETTVFASR